MRLSKLPLVALVALTLLAMGASIASAQYPVTGVVQSGGYYPAPCPCPPGPFNGVGQGSFGWPPYSFRPGLNFNSNVNFQPSFQVPIIIGNGNQQVVQGPNSSLKGALVNFFRQY